MATKTITRIEDDIDGSDASETVRFGLNGADYEIDLSDTNAAALRDAIGQWASHARRIGGRRQTSSPKTESSGAVDNKAVRAWAHANKIELNSRGRIPAEIIEQYRKAGN